MILKHNIIIIIIVVTYILYIYYTLGIRHFYLLDEDNYYCLNIKYPPSITRYLYIHPHFTADHTLIINIPVKLLLHIMTKLQLEY